MQDITIVTTLCRILDAFFEFMSTKGGFGQSEFFPLIHVMILYVS
jgi:hypothetical protein